MVLVKYHTRHELATRNLENLGRKFAIQEFCTPFQRAARRAALSSAARLTCSAGEKNHTGALLKLKSGFHVADVGEVAVFPIVIQAVPHKEEIPAVQGREISIELMAAAAFLIHRHR